MKYGYKYKQRHNIDTSTLALIIIKKKIQFNVIICVGVGHQQYSTLKHV